MNKYKAIQHIEIELSETEKKKITIEYLSDKFQWPYNYVYHYTIIDDNVVGIHQVSAGPHSYEEEKLIRPASDIDKAIHIIMKSIQ